jgi:hypothetical protein
MWAQILNVLLGLWLMAAPAVLGYGGAAADNDRVVGPIAATFAAIAISEATRGVRLAVLPLGLWMLVGPWLLGGPAPAIANGLLVGLALIGFSLVRGRFTATYAGGWMALLRGHDSDADSRRRAT